MRTRISKKCARRGAAVVEMAVVTPILLMMIFGVMEFGWVLMVRETMTNATREACRVRVLQGSTDTDARTRFDAAMAPTGVALTAEQVAITFNAATKAYTVTATVPRTQISLTGVGGFLQNMIPGFLDGNVQVSSSMRQEGQI